MRPIRDMLEERVSAALARISGQTGCAAMVRPAADARFGDYQANGVMALAKKMGTSPRKLAEQAAGQLGLEDMCLSPEVAGPGFINLRLRPEFLGRVMREIAGDSRLGIEKAAMPKTVVVDYSGPNIAKQMHVGHLRSTIIGDCICRILECLGHKVIRQNHIGDWGTQFGMLIAYFEKHYLRPVLQAHPGQDHFSDWSQSLQIADLEEFYRKAKEEFDSDPEFAKHARDDVVKLHSHHPGVVNHWEYIVEESRRHYEPIYKMLGVLLTKGDERGESFYAERLGGVVDDLKRAGMAVESEGAVCVFPEGFKNKEGQPLPFIIQKSDGAFLYATTDLAALRYRVAELKADEIVYVTDARQAQHFAMLFAVARKAGWAKETTELVHVTFGTMLGTDGKPFKTRSGETVKLKELLDEAVERARGVVEQKNPELPEEQKKRIAQAVGIGAVKYADYSNNRDSDYVFSFEKMLAMEGNTAPYMQYAYARVRSIERKAETRGIDLAAELAGLQDPTPQEPAEIELAKQIVRYGEAIATAAQDCRPNYLTAYLYDLAQKFSNFYNACPVLDAEASARARRMLLCDLTAKTIRHGLSELL
ncbi:MAG: arginine--tRNA ligase, partial [Phycisphaerae bacterium]|nr:arginine--tRNA ligase [Phycisphaerae bacterium]